MNGVGIAELKPRLREHLQSVRQGRTLTVPDRDTPNARIVPVTTDTLEVRKATRRPADLRSLQPLGRTATPTDSLSVLLEDRRRR
jgi:antitoxin (DNA-binding transcriptional repressor) of toxin-antitoxin stability system